MDPEGEPQPCPVLLGHSSRGLEGCSLPRELGQGRWCRRWVCQVHSAGSAGPARPQGLSAQRDGDPTSCSVRRCLCELPARRQQLSSARLGAVALGGTLALAMPGSCMQWRPMLGPVLFSVARFLPLQS